MTEKEKMLSKCFMTRMMLKSYQMIGIGQRIFVMITTSFAHLKSFLHCDEIVKGKLHQYFFEIICFRNSRDIFYSPLHNGIKYRQQILPFQC